MKKLLLFLGVIFFGVSCKQVYHYNTTFVNTLDIPITFYPGMPIGRDIDFVNISSLKPVDSYFLKYTNGQGLKYNTIQSMKLNHIIMQLDEAKSGDDLSVINEMTGEFSTELNTKVATFPSTIFPNVVSQKQLLNLNSDVEYNSYFNNGQLHPNLNIYYRMHGTLRRVLTDTMRCHVIVEYKILQTFEGESLLTDDLALHFH